MKKKVYIYVYDFDENVFKIGFNSLIELDEYTMDCSNMQELLKKLINDGYLQVNRLYTTVKIFDLELLHSKKDIPVRYSLDVYDRDTLYRVSVEFFTNNYNILKNSPFKNEFISVSVLDDLKLKSILSAISRYFSKKLSYRNLRELYFFLKSNGASFEDKKINVDELDKLNESDKLNELDKLDELDRLDETDKLDKLDELDRLDETDKLDKLDELDRLDETDKLDKAGKLEKLDYLAYLIDSVSSEHIDEDKRYHLMEELAAYDIDALSRRSLGNVPIDGASHNQDSDSKIDMLIRQINDANISQDAREQLYQELLYMTGELSEKKR